MYVCMFKIPELKYNDSAVHLNFKYIYFLIFWRFGRYSISYDKFLSVYLTVGYP